MRRRTCALLLFVLFSSYGCSAEPSTAPPPAAPSGPATSSPTCSVPAEGTTAHTLEVAGGKRRFAIDVPEGAGGRRLPVVYVIHGLGGEATTTMAYTGFPAFGATHGFITVAPQALGDLPRWDFATGPEVPGSDMDFLARLTEHVVSTWCGSQSRQYLTGFSNGSAMTFAAACFAGLDFAAYGAVAAGYLPDRCAEAPPASIIYAHGTADPVVPFEGGDTVIERVAPAASTMQQWADHNRCAAPHREQIARGVTLASWDDCADGARLEFYVIDGGGHVWPGGAAHAGLGQTTSALDMTAQMVEFFGLSSPPAG